MEFIWSPEHAHMIRAFVHCTLEMLEVHTQTPELFLISEKADICYSLRIKIDINVQRYWAVITEIQICVHKQSMCYHNGLNSDQI